MKLIARIVVMAVCSGLGIAVGTVAATPVIAYLNYIATDGPIFPAPLVAFGMLALPIAVILLLPQGIVVAYETLSRRSLTNWLWLVGLAAGAAAGLTWLLALSSSRLEPEWILGLIALGLLQGAAVFGGYWTARMIGGKYL